MKNYISGIGMLILLIAVLIQEPNTTRKDRYYDYIEVACIEAKQQASSEGYYTNSILNALRTELATKCKVPEGEIIIVADTTRVNRPQKISLRVEVPIYKAIAGANLLGISDEENKIMYPYSITTTSEYLE